jgi:membrane protease YdiL (CAAX protease family)
MFISVFFVAGLGEELGWTGFLIPRLQARFNALTSSLIRALLVGIWHLPLLLFFRNQHPGLVDFPYAGWIAQKGFIVSFAALLALFVIPWAIYLTWIFNNTRGSLLLASVLHGSEICVVYWMLRSGINPNNLDNYWGYGFVMVVVAITIVVVTGRENLSRKRKRVAYQAAVELKIPDV